jgi:FtsP/CotA-like multicopper oxidase with cupredoxin domain
MRVSRRTLIAGASAFGFGSVFPLRRGAADPDVTEFRLSAKLALVNLIGDGPPRTAVWAYDGVVPGPEIRARQGSRVRILVSNRLGEDTTVHWHGIRVPNAMDGVPRLTQPPIRPGDSFTYEFDVPDAGTFWYHPHADTLQQLGRGLAAPLIVEEREPLSVDRDLLWFIQDWRLLDDAEIAPGFGNRMEAGMSGRIGNTVTVNGRMPEALVVRAGERLRLRIVNAALARILALRFAGHRPVVVAYDGQPCEPHSPEGGRLLLGPAMRADLIIDMQGKPGSKYPVVDDFYRDLEYKLLDFAYGPEKPVGDHPPGSPPSLPANPLPEPDLGAAARHQITLQGGMMGGMGMMRMMGMGGPSWALNGVSMNGDGRHDAPPLLKLGKGQSCLLSLRNETAWWHPMHLHGHAFRVVSRNGKPNRWREWRDTVLIAPHESADIAFVADNPGDWMFHCHIIDHQETGMMATFRTA